MINYYCFKCNSQTEQTNIVEERSYFNRPFTKNDGRKVRFHIYVCEKCSNETKRFIEIEPVKECRKRTYRDRYSGRRVFIFNKGLEVISDYNE